MEAPPVQYVTTADGYSIAYTDSGQGEDLVFLPLDLNHVQNDWEIGRSLRPWLTGLSEHFRLVRYDGRGQGLSMRGLPPNLSIADLCRDIEALTERLSLRASIFVAGEKFCHVAVRFAAAHPERVRALVLIAGTLTGNLWPWGGLSRLAEQSWDLYLRHIAPRNLSSEQTEQRLGVYRQAINQADFLALSGVFVASDITQDVQELQAPTLILHPRGYHWYGPDEATKLASRVKSARVAMIDGGFPIGDAASGISAIERFLADLEGPEETSSLPTSAPAAAVFAALPDGLSAREIEVLRIVAAGRSNQQIADALVISLNTVARHVSHIFEKTGAANRTEAAGYARDKGLV